MLLLLISALAGLPGSLARAQAPLNERVLVVYNANERDSRDVASYYMAKRAIPAANKCKIDVSSTDEIKQDEFDSNVKRPVRKCLEQIGKDNILYIVFSYKTPWLLEVGPQTYALDQFTADIWDGVLPERPANMPDVQPYFGAAQSEGDVYQPFVSLADYRRQANARRIYSIWRLDAATPTVAKGLVDKALYAEAHGLSGNACFDRRTDPVTSVADFGYGAGDWDIHAAAEMARRAGFPVIEDAHAEEFGTAPAPLRCDHAALYAGWYSLNHYNDAFTWNPGAIGIHLDSASATNARGGANWAANFITCEQLGIQLVSMTQMLGYPDESESTTMINWETGRANAHYWTLKLVNDNFGPGDKLLATSSSSSSPPTTKGRAGARSPGPGCGGSWPSTGGRCGPRSRMACPASTSTSGNGAWRSSSGRSPSSTGRSSASCWARSRARTRRSPGGTRSRAGTAPGSWAAAAPVRSRSP